MGIVDSLVGAGWKPEENSDGEFKPLVGTYEVEVVTLRPEIDQKNSNAKYYQFELKPLSVLDGDAFGEKFSFRKRYYVDGDKAQENLKKLLNDLFTLGVTLDTTSDEAMEASFVKAIGVKGYVRSWGWTPEGKSAVQMFVVQKPKVAQRKVKADTLPF